MKFTPKLRAALAFSSVAVVLLAGGSWVFGSVTAPTRDDRSVHSAQYSAVDVAVIRVIDGDTLRVRLDGKSVRVRLLGIDAPEVSHNGSSGECFGDEATRELARLVPVGSLVRLVPDRTQDDVDQWQRLLRYVEVDRIDVGQSLLSGGLADLYPSRPPVNRADVYEQAQRLAKSRSDGLWGSC